MKFLWGWGFLVVGFVMAILELLTRERLGWIVLDCTQMVVGAILLIQGKNSR